MEAVLRRRIGAARLLARQAEVPDEPIVGAKVVGIAQVEDLSHAIGAPALDARDEVGQAALAVPLVLVGSSQPGDERADEGGLRRIGDVPQLMGDAAVGAQHVDLVLVALRQIDAVADSDHLRLPLVRRTGDVGGRDVTDQPGATRIRHVQDRGSVVLHLPGERVPRLAGMVSDVEVPAAVDRVATGQRLVGRAPVERMTADEPQIVALGPMALVLRRPLRLRGCGLPLGDRGGDRHDGENGGGQCRQDAVAPSPRRLTAKPTSCSSARRTLEPSRAGMSLSDTATHNRLHGQQATTEGVSPSSAVRPSADTRASPPASPSRSVRRGGRRKRAAPPLDSSPTGAVARR